MAVKLYSPVGNLPDGSTHLGLTSGHSFLIPHDKEGIEVPARFRREAIANGCLPVGMEPEEEEAAGFDREKVILQNINKMLDSDDPTAFTKDGKPNLNKLASLCGFQLNRTEVNKVWDARMATGTDDDDKPEMLNA